MDGARGTSPAKNMAGSDSPEQLLDAFKAAAMSVTKLYRASAAAQSKARSEGYQDCLEDLLAFLDKANIGVSDGEGWRIRGWATERLDGKDSGPQIAESEDEAERAETASSPEPDRSNTSSHQTTSNDSEMRTDSAPSAPTTIDSEPEPPVEVLSPQFNVPSQDAFTFTSSMPYPEPDLNMENLDLSDSRPLSDTTSSPQPTPQVYRTRHNRSGQRPRTSGHLGRGAGQKRKINIAEFFDLGNIGGGKDMFGNGGKRSRHA